MSGLTLTERTERCLFWIETIGFLTLAISWIVLEPVDKHWASYHREFITYSKLCWKFTNFLYFLSYAASLKSFTVSFEGLASLGSLFVKNTGFVLERLAMLIFSLVYEFPDVQDDWPFWSTFLLLILFNIYFAWSEYSTEFRPSQDPQNVYSRGGQVLFWIERLGLSIVTFAFIFWDPLSKVVGADSLSQGITVAHYFWMFTTLLYLLMSVGRVVAHNYDFHNTTVEGEMVKNLKKHPGFWLELLALLLLMHGFTLFKSPDHFPMGYTVIYLCLGVIFPLLHIYFACYGYYQEFQTDILIIKKTINDEVRMPPAKEETQQCLNMAPTDGQKVKTAARVMDQAKGKKNQSQHQEDYENLMNKNKCCASISFTIRDIDDLLGKTMKALEERIYKKIEKVIEENLQKFLQVKSEGDSCSWQKVLKKVVEKYEDDNQRLKEQLAVATASFELYRNLLHDRDQLRELFN